MAECSGPPCPTTTPVPTTTTTTVLPNLKVEINIVDAFSCSFSISIQGKRVLIGDFENTLHDVSGNKRILPKDFRLKPKTVAGTVFTLGKDRLLIEDFTYDGNGPDAFFYIGTEGAITKALIRTTRIDFIEN